MSDDRGPHVVELTAQDTHRLRRSVLRSGTSATEVRFDGDDRAGTVHLGVSVAGTVVAISSWFSRPYPGEPDRAAMQLRGMATDPSVRSTGLGALLLAAGLEHAVSLGTELVWARARDTALGFYARHGFETRGDGYVDPATGLAHHDVVRFLTTDTR